MRRRCWRCCRRLGEQGLDKVNQGLNTAFRERPGRLEPTDLSVLARPAVWLPLLLVLAAVAVYLMPQSWIPGRARPAVAASAASCGDGSGQSPSQPDPGARGGGVAEAAPVFPPEPASGPAAAPAEVTGTLQLRVSGESWVEVLDASGAALLQRMLQPGEAVGLDGTPPFKVKIGNAAVDAAGLSRPAGRTGGLDARQRGAARTEVAPMDAAPDDFIVPAAPAARRTRQARVGLGRARR